MNCPRCSAELPDSSLSCSRCGYQVRPVSFSYLPAGSPPWPATVPQNVSYSTGTGIQTIQAARPAQLSPAIPATGSKSVSKKSTLSIPAMLGLFFLSILIGGGATLGILYANGRFSTNNNAPTSNNIVLPAPDSTPVPSPTTGTQLPPPASFKTLNSSDVGVSLKYPSDWAVQPVQKSSDSSYFTIAPQQNNGLFITIERFTATGSAKISGTNDVNSGNLAGIQGTQGITNFQVIQPTMAQRTVGGVPWDEVDATFANANGVTFHMTSIAVLRNHLYYDISFFAPIEIYDQAVQEYYLPMLNSFKFLS